MSGWRPSDIEDGNELWLGIMLLAAAVLLAVFFGWLFEE